MQESILGKIWQQKLINEDFVNSLKKELGISDFVARILSTRTQDVFAAQNFLNPRLKNLLPDPFHLHDMDKAVDRTIKAIKNKEKICIFADYDVDGATSSALIKNFLREIDINAHIYVPDRIAEGYGPTQAAMSKIRKAGSSLMISVDCGSVAFDALNFASQIGLDIIVIDHHLSLDKLPKAVAIVNPNRLDQQSECKNLAAVGVAFLFIAALLKTLKERGYLSQNNIQAPDLLAQLDLVALGTVCDVMSLTGLNRAFVSQGLKVARKRFNIGYRELCDIACIDDAINCYHLGFVIGPRINAGGRVGRSDLGANLLSSVDCFVAKDIAKELDRHNEDRKVIELSILEEAFNQAEMQKNDAMIFVSGDGWHPGVIGIVAGRIKEKYNKPTAVVAINDGVAKASCRSVVGVDFGSALFEAKNQGLLLEGGGHAMAAGFTVLEENIENLKRFLNEIFQKKLRNSKEHLFEQYEINLSSNSVTIDLMKDIEILEPFGTGNPSPVFKFDNLYVLKANIVGSKHISVLLVPTKDSYASKPLKAIVFNAVGTKFQDVLLSKYPYTLSVFGNLKVNMWQGNESIQLHIKDILIYNR